MKLEREDVLAAAVNATGFTDFGEPSFLEGLDSLLDSISCDRLLREDQRPAIQQRVVDPLVKRLKLYADRTRYPEIAAQRIEKPLIVIGMPRSGTTFLHALLAQDPDARSPLAWQLGDPSPPPRRETIDNDPRIAAVDTALAGLPAEFLRMHMVGAKLPDECNAIMMMGFTSPNFGAALDVPSYEDWYAGADARPALANHRHTLQHLQAFTDGAHWVLKGPPHMFHMEALLDTYPDARIVFPHRDPAQTLPSQVSLIALIRSWTYGQVDRLAIGREMTERWAAALDRTLAFRADPRHADCFVDVSYLRLIAEPIAVVQSIYAHFGMNLSAKALTAMERFLADKPKDKHGTHTYTLEEAGLTRQKINRRFGQYLDQYSDELTWTGAST